MSSGSQSVFGSSQNVSQPRSSQELDASKSSPFDVNALQSSNTPPTETSNDGVIDDKQNTMDEADDELTDVGSESDIDIEAMVNAFQPPLRPSFRQAIQSTGYDLRPPSCRNDREYFEGAGWHDRDDTGNYDPASESKRLAPKRKRGKNDVGKQFRKQQKTITHVAGDGPDLTAASTNPGLDVLDDENDGDIDPRPRYRTRKYLNDKAGIETKSVLGKRSTDSDARGCRGCLELNLDCSLEKSSTSHPCEECLEDGEECILINQPGQDSNTHRSISESNALSSEKQKFVPTPGREHVTCHHCRSNKVRCSINSIKSTLPCVKCRNEGLQCTFESLSRSNRQTQTSSQQPRYKRVKSDKYDLSRDHNAGWDDRNLHVSRRYRVKKKPSKPTAPRKARNRRASSSVSESDHEPHLDVELPPGAITKFIKTSFCHPIHFNYIPPDPSTFPDDVEDKEQCNFCYDGAKGMFYSIFGIDVIPLKVFVIDMQNGTGYKEVTGGWKGLNKPETRMCQECVFNRMQIALCTGHEIRRIANTDMETIDDLEVVRKLFTEAKSNPDNEQSYCLYKDPRSLVQMDMKWCSICPYPAFWECCTPPEFNQQGSSIDPLTHNGGCGLNLCATCATRMLGREPPKHIVQVRGRKVGVKAISDLDSMLRFADGDVCRYPDGLRADAGLLSLEGELMVRFSTAFGVNVLEKDIELINNDGDDENDGDDLVEIEEPRTAKWKGKGKATDMDVFEHQPMVIEDESEEEWRIYRPPYRYGTAGSSSRESIDLT